MRYFLLVMLCLLGRGVAAQSEVDVIDGRRLPPPENTARWAAEPAVIEARAAAERYYRRLHPRADYEFQVMSVSRGSFTSYGSDQFAILFNVGLNGRCCPLGAIAVVEDGRLVRNVAYESNDYYLHPLPDVDGNGLNELVALGSFMGQGVVESWVSVLQFAPEGLRTLGATALGVSPCGSMMVGSVPETRHVTVEPADPPQFFVYEYRKRGCDGRGNERGSWSIQGTRAPLALDPVEGSLPTELLRVSP